jgi:putative membrane protein
VADSGQKPPDDDGTEPDPRYTFANERTFLAWSRTALALVVAGLGVVPLIVFGAVVAVTAYREWITSQRAMRHEQPLPRSIMPVVMTVIIAAMAVVAAVVVLVSALR